MCVCVDVIANGRTDGRTVHEAIVRPIRDSSSAAIERLQPGFIEGEGGGKGCSTPLRVRAGPLLYRCISIPAPRICRSAALLKWRSSTANLSLSLSLYPSGEFSSTRTNPEPDEVPRPGSTPRLTRKPARIRISRLIPARLGVSGRSSRGEGELRSEEDTSVRSPREIFGHVAKASGSTDWESSLSVFRQRTSRFKS